MYAVIKVILACIFLCAIYLLGVTKGIQYARVKSFPINLALSLEMYKMREFIDEVAPEKQDIISLDSTKTIIYTRLLMYEAYKKAMDSRYGKKQHFKDRIEKARAITNGLELVRLDEIIHEEHPDAKIEFSR